MLDIGAIIFSQKGLRVRGILSIDSYETCILVKTTSVSFDSIYNIATSCWSCFMISFEKSVENHFIRYIKIIVQIVRDFNSTVGFNYKRK